jgi:hypothetical protein
MRAINQRLLALCMMIMVPVLASAHPGHDHSGNLWHDLVHFMFTQYVYVIMIMVVLFLVGRRVYKLRSR